MVANLPNVSRFFSCLLILASLPTCVISEGCRHTEAAPVNPMTTVMQTIRDYGHTNKLASLAKSDSPHPAAQTPELYDLEEPYKSHIKSILAQEDFANLETEVHDARINQARVQGGAWKLFMFYEAVSSPLNDQQATDSGWQSHLNVIRKCIAARPGSAAAHIALADVYANYAWSARGDGYANAVSDSGWQPHTARVILLHGEHAAIDGKLPAFSVATVKPSIQLVSVIRTESAQPLTMVILSLTSQSQSDTNFCSPSPA
jgi:hypothetical protein